MPGSEKPNILKMVDNISDLPVLPQVLTRLIHLIGDERSSGTQVAEVMSRDPALAARVLRVANSSFYAMSRRITSIRDAVVILGFSTVRSLAISASVMNYFKRCGFSHEFFWQQSLACALISDLLARKSGVVDGGTSFTAGLLCGVGQIVFEQNLPDVFTSVVNMARERRWSFARTEAELVIGSSVELSYYLMQRWKLSENLQNAIRYQYTPRVCQNEEYRPLAVVICLARYLYRAQGEISEPDFDDLPDMDEELWAALRLPAIEDFADEIYRCTADAKASVQELCRI